MNDSGIAASPKSRARFSLGSLFLVVTAIGGCLAAMQFKLRLRDTDWYLDFVRTVIEPIPVSSTILLLSLQIGTLIISAGGLAVWRGPSMLWIYAASQSLWLACVAVGLLFGEYIDRFAEPILALVFFEPSCGLVFAGMAWCQFALRRHWAGALTIALILVLCFLAEFCAAIELDAFASALGAAIGSSR